MSDNSASSYVVELAGQSPAPSAASPSIAAAATAVDAAALAIHSQHKPTDDAEWDQLMAAERLRAPLLGEEQLFGALLAWSRSCLNPRNQMVVADVLTLLHRRVVSPSLLVACGMNSAFGLEERPVELRLDNQLWGFHPTSVIPPRSQASLVQRTESDGPSAMLIGGHQFKV